MTKGVIFDFNGTLIFDTEYHNRAWDIFLEKYGIEMDDSEKLDKIHGRSNKDIIINLFGSGLEMETMINYSNEKEKIYRELCREGDVELAPGAVELIEKLKNSGIEIAIATSSGYENIEFYMERFSLLKWFAKEKIVYNDGTIEGKPAPDLFIRAMERIGCNPYEIVVFEDSFFGIEGALKSGIKRVVVVNPEKYVEDKISGYEIIRDFRGFSL